MNAYQEAYERLGNASDALREAYYASNGDYIGLDVEDLKLLAAMERRCTLLQQQVDKEAVK